jgi:hypothetical protein
MVCDAIAAGPVLEEPSDTEEKKELFSIKLSKKSSTTSLESISFDPIWLLVMLACIGIAALVTIGIAHKDKPTKNKASLRRP